MHTPDTYAKSKLKPTIVYWIHYEQHSDPYSEGYVGVTCNLPKRIYSHKTQSHRKHVFNRLMKGAVITVLHECIDRFEALNYEKKYRPDPNIGWNIFPGGEDSLLINPKGNRLNTGTHKQKLKGDNRTEKQKQASINHKLRMKQKIPHNKGKFKKIEINNVIYDNAYIASETLGFSLSKIYRVGKKIEA